MSSEFDGVYELLPDVAEVFKMENKLNKEMVFVVHYSKVVVGEGHNFSQYYKTHRSSTEPSAPLMKTMTPAKAFSRQLASTRTTLLSSNSTTLLT